MERSMLRLGEAFLARGFEVDFVVGQAHSRKPSGMDVRLPSVILAGPDSAIWAEASWV
jgi:hypothetical protein